jgi:hypothetical protein
MQIPQHFQLELVLVLALMQLEQRLLLGTAFHQTLQFTLGLDQVSAQNTPTLQYFQRVPDWE